MTAEKIPGLAVSNTTRVKVCHSVAPSANEPFDKCFGTLNTASSAIENIVGITAKAHCYTNNKRITLVKVNPQRIREIVTQCRRQRTSTQSADLS